MDHSYVEVAKKAEAGGETELAEGVKNNVE